MNKKGISDILKEVICPSIIFLFVLITISTVGTLAQKEYQENLCDKFSKQYGLVTKLTGSWYEKRCYIEMEDGTKVLANDFNIAMVKVPMRRTD